MNFTDITSTDELWQFMTTPSAGLITSMKSLASEDMIILGGSGKMGKELVGLLQHADQLNGVQRKIMVASTFSKQEDLHQFREMGITCFQGDLGDESFLDSLPDAPYVVYMMGFKFGSSGDWNKAFHMNSIVPYLVGRKYRNSSILVFSSGNPYPHTDRYGPGANEKVMLQPMGVYGWTIVARESSFRTTAGQHIAQRISIFRLMYAQHLQYGVLIDLARMIVNREPISLGMPAVNLISQRDANEVALKSFIQCNKTGWLVNAAGPVYQVKDVVESLAKHLGEEPIFAGPVSERALLADDSKARQAFGEYRDYGAQMIEAAALWVRNGGDYWNKPTLFGRVSHDY